MRMPLTHLLRHALLLPRLFTNHLQASPIMNALIALRPCHQVLNGFSIMPIFMMGVMIMHIKQHVVQRTHTICHIQTQRRTHTVKLNHLEVGLL